MNVLNQLRVCEELRHRVSPISQARVCFGEMSTEQLLDELIVQCQQVCQSGSASLRHLFPYTLGFLRTAREVINLSAEQASAGLMSRFPHTQSSMTLLPGGLLRSPEFPVTLFDLHLALYSLATLTAGMLLLKQVFPSMYAGELNAFRNAMGVAVEELRQTASSLGESKETVLGVFLQFFLAGNPDCPFLAPRLFAWEKSSYNFNLTPTKPSHGVAIKCEDTSDVAVSLTVNVADLTQDQGQTVVARDLCWSLVMKKTSETTVEVSMISAAGKTSEQIEGCVVGAEGSANGGQVELVIIQQKYCVSVFSRANNRYICRLNVVEAYDSGVLSTASIIGFGGRIDLPTLHDNNANYVSVTMPSEDTPSSIPVQLSFLKTSDLWGVRLVAPIFFTPA